MVIKIKGKHIFRDMTSTPTTIADTPKMTVPVTAFEFGKFLHEHTRTTTFQTTNNIADAQTGRVTQMDMVFTYNAFDDLNIQRITYLTQYIATTQLYVALQDVVTILCNPNQVDLKAVNRMGTTTIFHTTKIENDFKIFVEAKALH